ncbi:hypothetical protein [Liquorilactobacillus sicerae]|uniref:hypothetical protein n=1 Tax=Liquorilactobacillus sicerae TaxID=1416943 RepID=UPI0024813B02|nr:hypothetical protein [Liquorilactobacillus sicerae]
MAKTSIEKRPDCINNRERFEAWKSSLLLVKGKRQTSEPARMIVTERRTRYEIIIKSSNYYADIYLAT